MAWALPPKGRRCTARSKRSGKRCRNWRYTEPETGKAFAVCRFHGARGGAPAGNKNAVATGEHEAIWLDCLEDDERELVARVRTEVLAQVDSELRLLEIRERRMLQRIRRLAGVDLAVVEEETLEGVSQGKRTRLRRTTAEATVAQVQRIEQALTRVQAAKTRLLDLKHRVEGGMQPEDASLGELARVIRESRAETGRR